MSVGRIARGDRIPLVFVCVAAVLLSVMVGVRGAQGDTQPSPPSAPCERGAALEDLGRIPDAVQAYLNDLDRAGGVQCATSALARLGGLGEICTEADSLAEAGETDAAKKAYIEVLGVDPISRCAKNGLADLSGQSGGEESKDFWEWTATAAKDIVSVLAFVAVAFLAAFALWLLLLNVLARTPGLRSVWPAKKVRRPTLEVKAFADTADDKLGGEIAGLVRGRVTRLRAGPDLVSGQAALEEPLKALTDLSGEVKSFVAVVGFLSAGLPRRRFEVAGELQAKGASGLGISAELTQDGRYASLRNFWAHEYEIPDDADDAAAYQRLSVPVAAWADHVLTKAVGARKQQLLSEDEYSWILFLSGLNWQESGDSEKAESLYATALGIDGHNAGALANLGVIRVRHKKFAEGKDLLSQSIKEIEPEPRDWRALPANLNPDWYRAKYNHAVLHVNWALSIAEAEEDESLLEELLVEFERAFLGREEEAMPADQVALWSQAEREARDLLVTALEVMVLWPWRLKRHELTKDFLDDVLEPFALALLAHAMVGPNPPSKPLPAHGTPENREELLTKLKAGDLSAAEIVDYVEKRGVTEFRTQYNLACYYTCCHAYDAAAVRLRRSIEFAPKQSRPRIVKSALDDPALKKLLEVDRDLKRELDSSEQK